MQPDLLDVTLPVLGHVELPSYFVLVCVGFFAATWTARRAGEREGLDGVRLVDLCILCMVLGIVGARLLAVLTDGKLDAFVDLCLDPRQVEAVDALVARCTTDAQCGYHYLCDTARGVCHPPRDCLAALEFWQGGLTFYGGVLLAVPGGIWYARRHGLDVGRVADILAPASMLGLFFGRIGCFLSGCCYGAPTDSWVGVTLPGHAHPVHPTQLYEAAVALGLFVVLRHVARPRRQAPGEVFGWLLIGYGAARFGLELLRADPRGALGPLSTSQLLSIPLVLAGAYLLWQRRRSARAREMLCSGDEPGASHGAGVPPGDADDRVP